MMTERRAFVATALVVLAGAWVAGQVPPPISAPPINAPQVPVLFENARIVIGGRAIERGKFLMERGRLTWIRTNAQSGDLPLGGVRIDLTGKTVIPSLVNAHVHLGYDRGLTLAAEHYTRENIVDQLNRYQYAGVSAVVSLGTDPTDLVWQIANDQRRGVLGGARLISVGRGLAPPNAGPANAAMRPSAHGITTEADARAAVRTEIAKGAPFIKIWVDDRNGTVPKLSPSLYRAVIDEARAARVGVIAHVFYLEDARELVRAGVSGFAHLPRDAEIDDALAKEMRDRGTFVIPNLAVSENAIHDRPPEWLSEPLLRELISDDDLARLRASYERRSPEGVARARATYGRMQRSLARLRTAGVAIGFGTDGGAVPNHVHAFTDHRELQLMVEAGLTPADALFAATYVSGRAIAGLAAGVPGVGEMAEGLSADFIVLDGNPLEDIRATRRIVSVYSKGIEINRPALRAAWGR